MTKTEVIKQVLENKKARDFWGVFAPDAIDITVNESGRVVTFERVPCLCSETVRESVTCYQSPIENAIGEYPIVQIVVKKTVNNRYSFNRDAWQGCRVW